MNRKEIIELINYKGEYTKEVKKKLRELLKKYHPDHYKKEDNTFKLISEIKKELDSGKKISFENKKVYEKEHHNDYKITEEILDYIKTAMEKGCSMQGPESEDISELFVLK